MQSINSFVVIGFAMSLGACGAASRLGFLLVSAFKTNASTMSAVTAPGRRMKQTLSVCTPATETHARHNCSIECFPTIEAIEDMQALRNSLRFVL
jgi:hypothetical protein